MNVAYYFPHFWSVNSSASATTIISHWKLFWRLITVDCKCKAPTAPSEIYEGDVKWLYFLDRHDSSPRFRHVGESVSPELAFVAIGLFTHLKNLLISLRLKRTQRLSENWLILIKEWKESLRFHSTSKFQVRIEDSAWTIKFYEWLKRDGYSTSGNVEETLSFANYLNGLRYFCSTSSLDQNRREFKIIAWCWNDGKLEFFDFCENAIFSRHAAHKICLK